MSTNISKRLERLESEPIIASRLLRSTHSGDCESCVAHFHFMAALERYEREHGLYVEPPPEDIISLKCRQCGQAWPADVRGYTEEERDLMRRENEAEDPATYLRLTKELDLVIERRSIAMWGSKHFWARCDVGWEALREKGFDPRQARAELERALK
jgi:hypothetical protein